MVLIHVLAQAAAVLPAATAPPPAQQGVTTYGPEFFAAMQTANALEMVQRLPGFTLDTGDSVRGYEGAAGNVLVDSQRPTSKTDDLGEQLKRIPASAVARIDIIRGGAPGIDMQGKSVLANVIRKDGGGFRGLLAVANSAVSDGRNLYAVRAEGSGKLGVHAWEAALFVGKFTDDGYGDGPRVRTDRNGVTLLDGRIHSQGGGTQTIFTGAVEQPAWGGRLRLNARAFSQVYNANELDVMHVPDSHQEGEHDDDDVFQTEGGVRFERPFGDRWKLELVGLRQDKHERVASGFSAPGDLENFANDSTTAETIARGVLKFQQRPTLSWEAGGEGAFNTLESKTRFALNGAPIDLPAANVRVEEKRGEVFTKAVWRPFSTLTLEAGVREEGSQISSAGDVVLEKSLYFTKPRLLVTWAPDPKTQVRLRYERVVGQLDFGAFVASTSLASGVITAGNPNLEPEQAWVSEAAVERSFWGRGALVVTLRHSELTDVIDRAPFLDFDAPANIGSGTKDELILNLTLPFDKIGLKGAQLRATSTWRRSEVTDPTTHTGRPITDLRPNEWEAHFVQDLPAHRMSWGIDACCARITTTYRFNAVDIHKLDTYVAPFWEWKPKPDLSLRVEYDYATRYGYRHTLYQYAGARGTSPLAYVEDRDPHFGHVLYVRFRKTLG